VCGDLGGPHPSHSPRSALGAPAPSSISSAIAPAKSERASRRTKADANRIRGSLAESERVGSSQLKSANRRKTISRTPTLSANASEPSKFFAIPPILRPQTAKFHSPTEQSPEDSPRDSGLRKDSVEALIRQVGSVRGRSRVTAVCRDIGVSERTLERTFARTLAMSPKHFLRHRRFLPRAIYCGAPSGHV
jgi:AraC-like DNA-binding protein